MVCECECANLTSLSFNGYSSSSSLRMKWKLIDLPKQNVYKCKSHTTKSNELSMRKKNTRNNNTRTNTHSRTTLITHTHTRTNGRTHDNRKMARWLNALLSRFRQNFLISLSRYSHNRRVHNCGGEPFCVCRDREMVDYSILERVLIVLWCFQGEITIWRILFCDGLFFLLWWLQWLRSPLVMSTVEQWLPTFRKQVERENVKHQDTDGSVANRHRIQSKRQPDEF